MATSRISKAKATDSSSNDALIAKVASLEAQLAALEKSLSAVNTAHAKLAAQCAAQPATGSVDLSGIEARLNSLAHQLSRKQDKKRRI